MNCLWSVSLALFVALAGVAATPPGLTRLDSASLSRRQQSDRQALDLYRQGLAQVLTYADTRTDLFPGERAEAARLLTVEERESIRRAWTRFLDYILALESIERFHRSCFRLESEAREDSFLLARAAHTAKYRFALEFIQRAERNPALDTVLNDAVPELGLPAGTYARLKWQHLNLVAAGEFAAWESAAAIIGGVRWPRLRREIAEDSGRVWEFGRGRGEWLTVKNGLHILQRSAFKAWFPVQANAAEWMGDTRVYRKGQSLVSPAQVQKLIETLEPGDILLTRSEWYLSNIGLPGFWPHAALYIGTPEQRRRFFDDAGVRSWCEAQGGSAADIEALLSERYPVAYRASVGLLDDGHPARVIEAISEGVSFTSIEHTAACDTLAVLRPRLDTRDKAAALVRAYHFAGRPYDFNFDFQTDAALVCTELVFKAYEPRADCRGLQLPVGEVLGRLVTSANEIVRQFDAQCGTPEQQFDLVLFLDGHETARRAVAASLDTFRASWRRPKWHVR